MNSSTQRGYQIVDPGLAMPRWALSNDDQVRCLSYLMRRISQIISIPDGVYFELIKAQYIGGPYPSIGLYTHRFVDTDKSLCLLSFAIEEQLDHLVKEISLERLLLLSAEEDVRWQDVLNRSEERRRAANAPVPILRPLDAENLAASGFNPWHS